MDKTCKFPAQFYWREKKIYWSFFKKVELAPFIIVCTLEILSIKYEEYYYCHCIICLSSFFPWQCLKKTSSNSKCNSFTCFLYFSYLRSLKAKYQSLVIRKTIRVVSKDKQLVRTSILEAIMVLKKVWGELNSSKQLETVSESQNFIGNSGKCYGWPWWPI